MSEAELARARRRTQDLFREEGEENLDETEWDETSFTAEPEISEEEENRGRRVHISEARALLERSRRLLDKMNAEDREEAIALHEQIEGALHASDWQRLSEATAELADLLFYVEEG
jgi:hypothetical protein